jgi:hypothetical protein
MLFWFIYLKPRDLMPLLACSCFLLNTSVFIWFKKWMCIKTEHYQISKQLNRFVIWLKLKSAIFQNNHVCYLTSNDLFLSYLVPLLQRCFFMYFLHHLVSDWTWALLRWLEKYHDTSKYFCFSYLMEKDYLWSLNFILEGILVTICLVSIHATWFPYAGRRFFPISNRRCPLLHAPPHPPLPSPSLGRPGLFVAQNCCRECPATATRVPLPPPWDPRLIKHDMVALSFSCSLSQLQRQSRRARGGTRIQT